MSWNTHLSSNSKALPTDSGGKQGSKRHFHSHAPSARSCLHNGPPSSLQDTHARHKQALSKPSASLKKGHSYYKSKPWADLEAAISLCPPNRPCCHLPIAVRRQKPHRRKPASAATIPPRLSFQWLSDLFKQIQMHRSYCVHLSLQRGLHASTLLIKRNES